MKSDEGRLLVLVNLKVLSPLQDTLVKMPSCTSSCLMQLLARVKASMKSTSAQGMPGLLPVLVRAGKEEPSTVSQVFW